jgi:hypothetical protein
MTPVLVDGKGSEKAIVTFSYIKRFRVGKLHDYRELLEALNDVNIRWRVFRGHPFPDCHPSRS